MAAGEPVFGGTVVTYSLHTVVGRSALTGAIGWSYTRSDRALCTVVQESGKTIALYRHRGNCDELTALRTATGQRDWNRTLDQDGYPVNGTPEISYTADTVLVTTASVMYAIVIDSAPCDLVTSSHCGVNWFQYFPANGCRISGDVLGTSGVLIATVCGDGTHLVMHDRYRGPNTDQKFTAINWTVPAPSGSIPLSADLLVSAFDPTSNAIDYFDVAKGTRKVGATLSPAPKLQPVTSIGTYHAAEQFNDLEYLLLGATLYAVRPTDATVTWSMSASAMAFSAPPERQVYVVTSTAVIAVQLETGREATTYVAGRSQLTAARRVSSGFVIDGGAGTSAYL